MFDLPEDIYKRLMENIPRGMRTPIFEEITIELVEELEKGDGARILANLINKKLKPSEVVELMRREEKCESKT